MNHGLPFAFFWNWQPWSLEPMCSFLPFPFLSLNLPSYSRSKTDFFFCFTFFTYKLLRLSELYALLTDQQESLWLSSDQENSSYNPYIFLFDKSFCSCFSIRKIKLIDMLLHMRMWVYFGIQLLKLLWNLKFVSLVKKDSWIR